MDEGERAGYLSNAIHLWKGKHQEDDRLYVQVPYRERLKAKGLPGSLWDGISKAWHTPFSPLVVKPLREAFEGFGFEMGEGVEELFASSEQLDVALRATSIDQLPDLPTKTTGALHQRKMYAAASQSTGYGTFMEMGGGKSIVAVGLMDAKNDMLVLIQCPKNVVGVWPRELRKHSVREWNVWTSPEGGTVSRKASDLHLWLGRPDPRNRPRIAVVNYDAAWRPGMMEVLLAQRWDTHVLDESHKIKSAGGKASRFAAKLRVRCKRVFLLTGTPQPHGPEDVYGQFRAADPRIFGTNYNHFKKTYFKLRPIAEHVDVIEGFIDEDAKKKFTEKLALVSLWIPKSDFTPIPGGFDASTVWSLPAVERLIPLSTKTWRLYQDLKKDFVAEIDAGIVTADNALTKLLRLRQITSGHVRIADGTGPGGGRDGEVVQVGTEKRAALAEVLDDIPVGEPVVVFGVFHHDLDSIRHVAEEAGRPYLELSGRRRDGLTSDSTMAGNANEVLAVQLQSGGVGIDLTRSAYVVNYSLDYNLGNILQAGARYDRPGQSRPVTIVNLIAVSPLGGETVDGATYEALAKREQINQSVLDAIRRREL